MLVEFKVKNFLSFKKEVTFSMLTSGKNEHPENLIPFDENNNEYLLKTALIYGANASGKTNFLKAIGNLCLQVMTSKNMSTSDEIDVAPYLFDDKTPNEKSFFEIRFIQNNTLYIYGVELDSKLIYQEYLYKSPEGKFNAKPIKIFERTNDENHNLNINVSKLKKKYLTESAHNRLYLSVAGFWEDPSLVDAYKWFEEKVKVFIPYMTYGEDLHGYTIRRIINKPKEQKNYADKIVSVFKKIDTGITGLKITAYKPVESKIPKNISSEQKKQILELIEEEEIIRLESVHKVEGKEYPLNFMNESSGTQRALDLIGVLIDIIQKNGLLIIDELENSLHSELAKELIKSLHKNNCNAQIIFTTHDTSLMNLDIFRRDQFWFTEKKHKQQYSELFCLDEIKGIRNNENIQKKYLLGRYGAFPYINLETEGGLCK